MPQNIKTMPIKLLPTALEERRAFEAKEQMTQQAQRYEDETGVLEQAEAPGTPQQKEKQVRTAGEE